MGWRWSTSLEEGLQLTYAWFLKTKKNSENRHLVCWIMRYLKR